MIHLVPVSAYQTWQPHKAVFQGLRQRMPLLQIPLPWVSRSISRKKITRTLAGTKIRKTIRDNDYISSMTITVRKTWMFPNCW